MIETAIENGVEMIACQMSMDMMGIDAEELMAGVKKLVVLLLTLRLLKKQISIYLSKKLSI